MEREFLSALLGFWSVFSVTITLKFGEPVELHAQREGGREGGREKEGRERGREKGR